MSSNNGLSYSESYLNEVRFEFDETKQKKI